MSAPESFYCLEESEADKNFGLSDSHYSLPSLPMELEHFSAAYFQVDIVKLRQGSGKDRQGWEKGERP